MQNAPKFSKPPSLTFDVKQGHGYNVHVTYLTGDETLESVWMNSDTFYSIAGIKIELIGRFRYIHNLNIWCIQGYKVPMF